MAPDANVSWETAREANLSNWEVRVPIHESGYDIAAFDDPDRINDVVADDLPVLEHLLPTGTVDGLDLCCLEARPFLCEPLESRRPAGRGAEAIRVVREASESTGQPPKPCTVAPRTPTSIW